MALSSKDIRELMEARKARRAIPQTDPAEVVASAPEPELAGPPQAAPETPASAPQPTTVSASPQLEGETPATGPVLVVEPDDPRTQRAPADDAYVVTSVKIKQHQQRQLKAEAYHRGMRLQDIMETALDEYFRKRYGRQGRGQRP